MIAEVISGGQAGADVAGLRAARRFGIPTGGFAGRNWETEDGINPGLADWGLVQCAAAGYPARTRANIAAADLTVIFVAGRKGFDSPGTRLARSTLGDLGKPFFVIDVLGQGWTPAQLAHELRANCGPGLVLNVAGNRESGHPGIGDRVERYLCEMFRELGFEEIEK